MLPPENRSIEERKEKINKHIELLDTYSEEIKILVKKSLKPMDSDSIIGIYSKVVSGIVDWLLVNGVEKINKIIQEDGYYLWEIDKNFMDIVFIEYLKMNIIEGD